MKSISKLKDEARRYEQREEWERAIEVYLQVLRADDESEVELTLFNRVGDLCVRLGRPLDAVRYYEEAADRYADLGLYNNAIALCNKALRYQPDHLELMRKLGQFSASQGFLTDARRYFLEYAERKFKHGETDAALAALADFAGVVDDGEIRELLGRRLHAYGRNDDALRELRTAWSMYVHTGESDRAESVRAAILAIDPAAQLDAAPGEPADDPFAVRAAPETDDLPRFEPLGAQPPARPPAPPAAAAGPAATSPPRTDVEPPPAPQREPEPSAVDDRVEGLEHTGLLGDDADDDDDAFIELPYLDIDDDRPPAAVTPSADPVTGFEATTLDFGEARDLEELDLGPGLEREESSFDVDDDDIAFVMDDGGAAGVGSGPDLPYLDDEDAPPFELPLLDDETDSPPLPLLDDGFGDAPGPDAGPYAASAGLPLLDEDEAADVDGGGGLDEMRELDDDDATYDPPADEAEPLPLPEFGIHGELVAEPPIFEFDSPAPPAPTEPADALFGPGDLMPFDTTEPTELEGAPAPPLDLPDWLEVAIDPEDEAAATHSLETSPHPDRTDDADEAHDADDADDADDAAAATFDFPSVGDFWQDEAALLRRDDEPAPESDESEDPDFWRDPPPAAPPQASGQPPWQAFADAAWQTVAPTPADAETAEADEALEDPAAAVHGDAGDAPPPMDDAWPAPWESAAADDDVDASPEPWDFATDDSGEVDDPRRAPDADTPFTADFAADMADDEELAGDTATDDAAADVDEALDDAAVFEFDPAAAEDVFGWEEGATQPSPFAFADENAADVLDDIGALDAAAQADVEETAAAELARAELERARLERDERERAELAAEALEREVLAAGELEGGELAAGEPERAELDDADDDAAGDDAPHESWTPERLLDDAAPAVPSSMAPTAEPEPASMEDGYVDLGAMLREDQEETTRFTVQETAPTGDEDRDFAELLRQFKAKVSQHVPAEDAVAHYDLALAYKEMGLLDEAIAAFQVALRAGRMRLKIYEELGECFLQKRQFNIAEKVLSRALATGHEDELELLGVYYHLGRAYEAMGRTEQARDAYERVLGMDIGFQDVAERLARL